MSKGKALIIGFVVGGTISAATTLLTTPTTGGALRNRVKKQGTEWKYLVESIIQDGWKLKDQIAKTSKEGVALMNELTEEMKSSIEEWKGAVEPHQDNIYQYLEEIETSIKDLEEKMSNESDET